MASCPFVPTVVFWVVALVVSVLYGWNAAAIFTDVSLREVKPAKAWWWHQRWLNFMGSVTGWTALWLLFRRLAPCLFQECKTQLASASGSASRLDAGDAAMAFVAFVGITGYLPFAVVGLISGASTLSAKAGEVIKGLFSKAPPG